MIRESDKDVYFYTGLPSFAVFDRLLVLEYLNPDGRHSNVVYQATAKKWTSDCVVGTEPGEAKWRDIDSQVGQAVGFSQADELFLMLVRLHLNLKEYDLAQHFKI